MPRGSSHFRTRQKVSRRHASISEAYGWLTTAKTKNQIPLPVNSPQHCQDENIQATTPRSTKIMATDAETLCEPSRRNKRWSEGDVPLFHNQDSTRIESSSKSIATKHGFRIPDVISTSSLYGAQPDLETNDSTLAIHESSRNGHMITPLELTCSYEAPVVRSKTVDFLKFTRHDEDYRDSLHGDYGPESRFADQGHPKLSPVTQDNFKRIGYLKNPREWNQDQQGGLVSEERSRTKSYFEEKRLPLFLPHMELHSQISDPELISEALRNLASTESFGLNAPEPIADQSGVFEPEMEQANSEALNSDRQQHGQTFVSGISSYQASISAGSDVPNEVLESYSPKSILPRIGEDRLNPNGWARSESFKSQNSFGEKRQQQRRRREARLHKFLSRNLSKRADAHEKLVCLHQARIKVSSADEAFMKLIRDRWIQNNQEDLALVECYRRLQDTRDQCGPLEDAYNQIEEELNRGEFETKELEEKILMSDDLAPGSDPDSRSISTSESGSEAPIIIKHPLYDRYISQIWKANICREEISELLHERENLLHSQELRARVGLNLAPADQLTLEDFPAAEAKLLDRLARMEAEVEDLRLACIREGIFNEVEYENEEDEGDEQINLQPSSAGLVAPEQAGFEKYHLLMERPENEEDEGKSKILLTNFKQGNVGDRITCWLLHKLRLSGLEVELLASYADGLDRLSDTEKWQEDVLEFWFVDSANLESSAYAGKPTLTATPPAPIASPSGGFTSSFGNMHEVQIIIRSSALSQRLELRKRLDLKRTHGRSVITE